MRRGFICLLGALFLLLLPDLARPDYDTVDSPGADFYFGFISYCEPVEGGAAATVQRLDGSEAEAVPNVPLAPGDVVRADKGRCEIQFDTGTIIRLDRGAALKLETVMARSLSTRSKLTNLTLSQGGVYIMYKRYNRPEVFQLITPTAAVKLDHNAVVVVAVGDDGRTGTYVEAKAAHVLYGSDPNHIRTRKVGSKRSLTVTADNRIEKDFRPDPAFLAWNEKVNRDFTALHEGRSFLPKPIERYPRAVVDFARRWSNLYGEWIWNSLYGYVWRSDYNDESPWGTWRPYFYGQWISVDKQMFWVPQERWGWVPYHLGLWVWDEDLGWLWIPGSTFAPAWVSWTWFDGYLAWRPWSMWDWYFYDPYFYGSNFYNFWFTYQPDDTHFVGLDHITLKGELRRGGSPFPLPRVMKPIYDSLVENIESGDERIAAAIEMAPAQLSVLREDTIGGPGLQERILNLGDLPEESVARLFLAPDKVDAFSKAAAVLALEQAPAVGAGPSDAPLPVESPVPAGSVVDSRPGMTPVEKDSAGMSSTGRRVGTDDSVVPVPQVRFRDWNPDVGVARKAGVSIIYSSPDNAVFCPELSLSSGSVSSFSNMTSATGVASAGPTGSPAAGTGSQGAASTVKGDAQSQTKSTEKK